MEDIAARKKVTTADMIAEAIQTLDDKKGSSLQAIKKFVTEKYLIDPERGASLIRKALKLSVENGKLIQTKGKGASGSFKLAKDEKPPKKAAGQKVQVATKNPPAKARIGPPVKKPKPTEAPTKPSGDSSTEDEAEDEEEGSEEENEEVDEEETDDDEVSQVSGPPKPGPASKKPDSYSAPAAPKKPGSTSVVAAPKKAGSGSSSALGPASTKTVKASVPKKTEQAAARPRPGPKRGETTPTKKTEKVAEPAPAKKTEKAAEPAPAKKTEKAAEPAPKKTDKAPVPEPVFTTTKDVQKGGTAKKEEPRPDSIKNRVRKKAEVSPPKLGVPEKATKSVAEKPKKVDPGPQKATKSKAPLLTTAKKLPTKGAEQPVVTNEVFNLSDYEDSEEEEIVASDEDKSEPAEVAGHPAPAAPGKATNASKPKGAAKPAKGDKSSKGPPNPLNSKKQMKTK